MQITEPFQSLEACFGTLEDPRVVGRCDHIFIEIILVAVCGVLCGAESWSEIEEFGNAKESWLRQYLELPAGIPSHDTFGWVFRLLDASAFQASFIKMGRAAVQCQARPSHCGGWQNGCSRRRKRLTTTLSRHQSPVATNVLNREFTVSAPNQKWLADITYIETLEGFLYLASLEDAFSRRIVGWAMAVLFYEFVTGERTKSS